MSRITRGALVLVIVIGSARAGYHLIRIAILAGIGLAGMYMLHTLAQDYNKIQANRPGRPGGSVAAAAGKALLRAIFKRSVDEDLPKDHISVSPLEQVLLQDPWGCARKIVCQLAARPSSTLRTEESNILRYLRNAGKSVGGTASVEFSRAIQRGEKAQHSSVCTADYPLCPFDASTIFKVLQFYG